MLLSFLPLCHLLPGELRWDRAQPWSSLSQHRAVLTWCARLHTISQRAVAAMAAALVLLGHLPQPGGQGHSTHMAQETAAARQPWHLAQLLWRIFLSPFPLFPSFIPKNRRGKDEKMSVKCNHHHYYKVLNARDPRPRLESCLPRHSAGRSAPPRWGRGRRYTDVAPQVDAETPERVFYLSFSFCSFSFFSRSAFASSSSCFLISCSTSFCLRTRMTVLPFSLVSVAISTANRHTGVKSRQLGQHGDSWTLGS